METNSHNFKLPITSAGTPSFIVIDNYLPDSFYKSLENDLQNFTSKSTLSNNLIVSDNNTRINYQNGDGEFEKLISESDSWKRLFKEYLSSNFFNDIYDKNIELLRIKEFDFPVKYIFKNNFNDYKRFSLKLLDKVVRKLKFFIGYNYFRYQFNKVFLKSYTIFPIINIAISKVGYEVPIHTDNRYKLFVGILYLSDLDLSDGGSTIFHKSKVSNKIESYERTIPLNETEEIVRVNPQKNRLVLFLNSNDGYHSVNSLKKSKQRNFIYFSFAVKEKENIWHTKKIIYDGGK